MSDINKFTKLNKYNINEKIGLYKENLIKFIIEQKNKIIQIGNIEDIDYIVGILFLTETNRYCKLNKITIHGYYLAFTFINIFNKLRKKLTVGYEFEIYDLKHFIISLLKNVDYLNSRIDPSNQIKNKILGGFPKFNIDMLDLLDEIFKSNKIHDENNLIVEKNKCCDINCNDCWITLLSKFFYLLLRSAKFLGSGYYNDPNLLRISEYYANIFCILLKSNDINFIGKLDSKTHIDVYDSYLNYKNKLNYSLIELNLNSETLDEIIIYLDKKIVENLSIGIK